MLNLLPNICPRVQERQYHKSTNGRRNVSTVSNPCKLCPRRFKSNVNLTLHVYWHTINNQERAQERDDDPDDPMEVIESYDEDEDELYRFAASPGWVSNFLARYNIGYRSG